MEEPDRLQPREQKSALLTHEVLSVEAGIEIDFRMVDSFFALQLSFQSEEVQAMSDLVEFRHLKYIVAVADAANITRAAEPLFLAQPYSAHRSRLSKTRLDSRSLCESACTLVLNSSSGLTTPFEKGHASLA
jgi:hypothetical protein